MDEDWCSVSEGRNSHASVAEIRRLGLGFFFFFFSGDVCEARQCDGQRGGLDFLRNQLGRRV